MAYNYHQTEIAMSAVLSERQTLPQRVGNFMGIRLNTEADIVTVVAKGLPTSAYRRLKAHVALEPTLIASETTMRRRLQTKGGKFTRDESEKLMRVARVFALAVEVFGDEGRARRWFEQPSDYISVEKPVSPLKLCETEPGGRLVEEHLRRAQYGFAA